MFLMVGLLFAQCSKKAADGIDGRDGISSNTKSVKVNADPALAWRGKAPGAGPARPIELGEYSSFELDNGLKVIVVENNKLPRVCGDR